MKKTVNFAYLFESLALRGYFDFQYYSDYYNKQMLSSKDKGVIMVEREIVLSRISKLDEYYS